MMNPLTLLAVAKTRVSSRPAPIVVGFELTHACNLGCRYCDRHARLPDEMSLPEIIRALEGLHGIGMREISLDGGEALAHPRVHDVVCWLSARGVKMRLNTNGALVRRKVDVVRRMQKLKISLDGPREVHESVRGKRTFEQAVDAVEVTRALGVPVEFTCSVGRHNAHVIGAVVDIAESLDCSVVFQPIRPSLFGAPAGVGSSCVLSARDAATAFSQIESLKRAGRRVLNNWASLRHFRAFPNDAPLPCAAGWINVTLDPEGHLYHCGQVNRDDKSNNVVRLGAKAAFSRLVRKGCSQCWCARVVEENYAWGVRLGSMLPLPKRSAPDLSDQGTCDHGASFDVAVTALAEHSRAAR